MTGWLAVVSAEHVDHAVVHLAMTGAPAARTVRLEPAAEQGLW